MSTMWPKPAILPRKLRTFVPFLPGEPENLQISPFLNTPDNLDVAAPARQRAVFRRVGCELVKGKPECLRGSRPEHQGWP